MCRENDPLKRNIISVICSFSLLIRYDIAGVLKIRINRHLEASWHPNAGLCPSRW